MATQDITRLLEQPRKHYAGVRMQQGRLLLDADFNEGSWLHEEDQRRMLQDLIGPRGTPDDGFSIGDSPGPVPPYDPMPPLLQPGMVLPSQEIELDGELVTVRPVSVRPGAFWLGGQRFTLEEAEPFAFQRDYLQLKPGDLPQNDAEPFLALYYLHGWEQSVSQIEDEELLEAALGGTDTSSRVRRMRRVETFDDLDETQTTCDAAFRRLLEVIGEGNAEFDFETSELKSKGRLRLTLSSLAVDDQCDECNPDPASRFLGADHRTLRVQLTRADRYVWAWDNAAPIYKVKITGLSDVDGGPVRVHVLSPLGDEVEWPLHGRVVEIVPFGAIVEGDAPPRHDSPFFKKVGERVGAFTRVDESFDPNTSSFTIDTSVGLEDIEALVYQWDMRHPEAKHLVWDQVGDERYFYMRLWHDAPTAADVEIPIDRGAPLLGTQLVPQFSPGRRGDFWVAAVRPGTPEPIVPADLRMREEGVAPHGPHDFYSPVGLVQIGGNPAVDSDDDRVVIAEDCRPRIRPLTDLGCVTCTVGDGVTSQGDFTSIQEAVLALPERGGRILVRRGTYRERVLVYDKDDIIIEGCGDSTIIETPLDEDGDDESAVIEVRMSDRFQLLNVRLHAVEERALSIVADSNDAAVSGVSMAAAIPDETGIAFGTTDTSVPLIYVSESQGTKLSAVIAEPQGRPGLVATEAGRITGEDLTFSGPPSGEVSPQGPMVRFEDCMGVVLRRSILSTFGQVGVAVVGAASQDVTLSELAVVAGQHDTGDVVTPSGSGVDVDGATRVRLESSTITMDASISPHACVVVLGDGIEVVNNQFEVLEECYDSPSPSPASPDECASLRYGAWGGIHVRGGAQRVALRANRILGGVGHGVTLGSILPPLSEASAIGRPDRTGAGEGQMYARPDAQLAATGSLPRSLVNAAGQNVVPEVEDLIEDLTIADNRIELMHGNGISVLAVVHLPNSDSLIGVKRLRIARNVITNNVRYPWLTDLTTVPFLPYAPTLATTTVDIEQMAYGGIVLGTAMSVDIHENQIIGNGTVGYVPTNGVFILNGDAINVSRNRIAHNGARLEEGESPLRGIRAGIAVMLAGTGVDDDNQGIGEIQTLIAAQGAALDTHGFALRVIGNSVLHPEGHALHAVASGPVTIHGNFLSSQGNHGHDADAYQFALGDVVYVQSLGMSWEFKFDGTEPQEDIAFPPSSPYNDIPERTQPYLDVGSVYPPETFADEPRGALGPLGEGGGILFSNNQVTYDWEVRRAPQVRFGGPPLAYFAVALISLDQVNLTANQFAMRLRNLPGPNERNPVMQGFSEPVLSTVFALGACVIASGNRSAETVGSTALSFLTLSQRMSLACANQGTHEIISINSTDPPQYFFHQGKPHLPGPGQLSAQPFHYQVANQVMFVADYWNITVVGDVVRFTNRFLGLVFRRS